MKELIAFCLLSILSTCWAAESLFANKCNMEPEPGFCNLEVERYFYNSTSMQCETFVYNGCGGNLNNFEFREECKRNCVTQPTDESGDNVDGNEDGDEDGDEDVSEDSGDDFAKIFGPYKPPKNIFGNLFRKGIRRSFGMFKPRPLMLNPFFNSFNPNQGRGNAGEDNTRRRASPFASIFGLLRPRMKPVFNPFAKTLKRTSMRLNDLLTKPLGPGRSSFESIFSKTIESIGDDFEKSFQTVTKTFIQNGKGVIDQIDQNEALQCEICIGVVKIVEYQLEVLKLSIKAILKLVNFICEFFPLAEKLCHDVTKDIMEIIKYLEQGLTPKEVCKNIQLCPNTTYTDGVSQNVSISFSRNCQPLCHFMKAVQAEKITKMTESWNATREKLERFCDENKIIKKCNKFYDIFERLFQHAGNITRQQNGGNCKCFNRQPLFDTKKFDSCLRCKQFEKGMFNELTEVDRSVSFLATRVKDICSLFPETACMEIVDDLKKSVKENNLTVMPNLCNVTGYCQNKKKDDLLEKVKETFEKLKGIFPDPNSMMLPGMGLQLRKFTPDCMFCKECMVDLKETFKNINATEIGGNIYPAVKEGFGLYCSTKTEGGEYKTVCKKIADGIETVHEAIGNEEGMCKTLGVC